MSVSNLFACEDTLASPGLADTWAVPNSYYGVRIEGLGFRPADFMVIGPRSPNPATRPCVLFRAHRFKSTPGKNNLARVSEDRPTLPRMKRL